MTCQKKSARLVPSGQIFVVEFWRDNEAELLLTFKRCRKIFMTRPNKRSARLVPSGQVFVVEFRRSDNADICENIAGDTNCSATFKVAAAFVQGNGNDGFVLQRDETRIPARVERRNFERETVNLPFEHNADSSFFVGRARHVAETQTEFAVALNLFVRAFAFVFVGIPIDGFGENRRAFGDRRHRVDFDTAACVDVAEKFRDVSKKFRPTCAERLSFCR